MNIFFIGVQKSGSSAISEWFSQHDEVEHIAHLKDVHFLQETYKNKNKNKFLNYYQSTQEKNNCLMVGVNYWLDKDFFTKDHKNYDFVLVLRHPVDRLISAYKYYKKLGQINCELEDLLNQYLEKRKDDYGIFESSCYKNRVSEVIKKCPNIHILKYEKFEKDPQPTLKYLCNILGVAMKNHEVRRVNISGNDSSIIGSLIKNKITKSVYRNTIKKLLNFRQQKLVYFKLRDSFISKVKDDNSKRIRHRLEKALEKEINFYNSLDDSLS